MCNRRYDLRVSADPDAPCPWCGGEVRRDPSARRYRIWCSDKCKRLAYEHRRAAAARDDVRVTSVTIEARSAEPTWDELIERVLASRVATRRVLNAVRDQIGGPTFEQHTAVTKLADAYRAHYRR